MPSSAEASRPASRLLPVAAIAVLGITLGLILVSAGDTLGYDYRAYEGAARRLLEGRPLYDPTVDVAGGFAIYLYPPPFALFALPFALLPGSLGVWTWIGGLLAAFLAGCWLLPVRRDVRWVIVLLGGAMWPLVYSIKLGQVGPLLFLAFALGWRWIDRPARLGRHHRRRSPHQGPAAGPARLGRGDEAMASGRRGHRLSSGWRLLRSPRSSASAPGSTTSRSFAG